ncbi:unnamed protein product [Polarella glacialis]|uniref:Uncharacterized protein n=1 Tax=Polarella glacialis TaxID=89957 RepID=A0A813IUQ3_POLGL|nr:unnamed protein product [Polarella glacialis]
MTATTSSSSAIPVAYEADMKLLHTDARRILDQYSIPYSIQATLARDGYVTIDDLSCRWDTPELARSNAEVDLGFSPRHTGWDKRASEHTCMHLYQAVKKAKSIETASNDTLGASGPREGVVLQAGKRASLEENYKKVTGTRPPLQEQGSDAFLSAQFKMCEKGEFGFFQTKQMVSIRIVFQLCREMGSGGTSGSSEIRFSTMSVQDAVNSDVRFTPQDITQLQHEPNQMPRMKFKELCCNHEVFTLTNAEYLVQLWNFGQEVPDQDYCKAFGTDVCGHTAWLLEENVGPETFWLMLTAMPDPLEMAPPVKGLKPVNGFLYQDDQEERKNPYSKEQWESVLVVFQINLLMCVWAFPNNRLFDLEKSDLDAFKFILGDEIAKRLPAPPLHVLMYAERTAWRKIAFLTHDGLSLKTALNRIMANSLFWIREVYEKAANRLLNGQSPMQKAYSTARTTIFAPVPTAAAGPITAQSTRKTAPSAMMASTPQRLARTPDAFAVPNSFTPVGGATGTKSTSSAEKRNLQGASGPDTNRSIASVEAGPSKVQKFDFALKLRVPSLEDNSKVPPPAERQSAKRKTADTAGAHLHRPLQTSVGEPSPWFPWLQHVPPRLRNRLRWNTSHSPPIPDHAIVILFAGKEDPTSLESAIHSIAPELSNSVVAIDLCRGKGNDLLASEPYSSLCTAGKDGKLDHCGGGPMCRTWTVRLWIPKEGGGVPLRGRSESTLWGLPTLTDSQRIKCDDDSMLTLRQLYLSSLAKMGNQLCSSFLEHPADPAVHRAVPGAMYCSSCWITKAVIAWGKELSLKLMIFDQCRPGQIVPKTTGSMTDLCLDWDKSFCNHADRHKDTKILSSGDLSRYPWGVMMDIANAIAAKQNATSVLESLFKAPEDSCAVSDRPKVAVAHAASSSSSQGASGPAGIGKEEIIQTGFKRRPIRDGGGKPSPGRRAPPKVGTAIMNACPSAARDMMASLARQDTDMPFEPAMMNTNRQLMCSGSWEVTKGQPFYLDLMTHTARKAFGIDSEYPQELKLGVPLGVDEEYFTLTDAVQELAGERLVTCLSTCGRKWVAVETSEELEESRSASRELPSIATRSPTSSPTFSPSESPAFLRQPLPVFFISVQETKAAYPKRVGLPTGIFSS